MLPGFQMLRGPQRAQEALVAVAGHQASSSQPGPLQVGAYGSAAYYGLPAGQNKVPLLALPGIPESSPPRQDSTQLQRKESNQSFASPGSTDLETMLDQAVDGAGSGASKPLASVKAPGASALSQPVDKAAVFTEAQNAAPLASTISEPKAEKEGISEQRQNPKEAVSAKAAIDKLNVALERRKETKEKVSEVQSRAQGPRQQT